MNLFDHRRKSTKHFLRQADKISLLSGESFSLVEITEIDRSFKCDDYRMIFENEGESVLWRGEEEIAHFSVYVCDWSNTITVSFELLFTDEERRDDVGIVSKPIKVKHPVTPQAISGAMRKHLAKYRAYLGRD